MKAFTKKGDIWVSAILYFGLGMVVLTLMLTAGTPIINRLRDKNVVLQTKELMHSLDDNIREIAREGPGSQRPLTLDVRKGEFHIDQDKESIYWEYVGKSLLAEPCTEKDITACVPLHEGNVKIIVQKGAQVGTYKTHLELSYDKLLDLIFTKASKTITGRVDVVIRNKGIPTPPQPNGAKVQIEILER
ncbi:hypothetical protein HZB00_02605 [Candidatus Woesearchaeota archaeon]|nr:hypothetical protein [Candidatus Woesearchaeota archaeon]